MSNEVKDSDNNQKLRKRYANIQGLVSTKKQASSNKFKYEALEQLREQYNRIVKENNSRENQYDTGDNKRGLNYHVKRSPCNLICDILLVISALIVSALSFLFFATPTTEIGGVVYKGTTLNLYNFIYGDANSLFVQIKNAIEIVSTTEINGDDIVSAISVVMKLLRLFFLALPAVIVAIKIVINVISTPIYFFTKKSRSLRNTAIRCVIQNLMVYVFFVFFGSISGGVGIDAYYIGYSVGKGMTIGVLIGLAILLIVSIVTYVEARSKTTAIERAGWRRSLISGIGYSGIAVVLTFMRIYSIFMYVFSSSLSTAVLSIQNGFEIKALIFPVLNLFLFIACLSVNKRVVTGFTGAFTNMLNYGSIEKLHGRQIKKKYKMERIAALSFVPVIVMSLISVVAVFILRNPTYGYGWAVDIYSELAYIFVIAAVSQSIMSFFKQKIDIKSQQDYYLNDEV